MIALAAAAFAFSAAATAGAPGLTLERAVRRALEAHPLVTAATLARQGEEIGLETARSDFDVRIVPTGTLGRIGSSTLSGATGTNSSIGVQVARRFEHGTSVAVGPSYNRFGSDRNTSLSVSVEQPLLRGWDRELNLDRVRRSEFALASAGRSLAQAREQAALEAIAAYHAVLRERHLVRFGQSQRERIERHALIARSKERSGIIGAMDAYRATIRLKDAEDALNVARVGEQAAENRLRRALDLPMAGEPLRLAEPEVPPLPAAAEVEASAVEMRLEVQQLRADLDEARRAASIAERNILPDVMLRVTAGQASHIDPLLANLVPTTQRQWNVSLQSSTDLSRTAERNAWRQARLRVEVAANALAARTEEVRRQVRDQWSLVSDARSRIALREAQISQAQSRLALAQVKFAHDMASNLDVIEAETELQRAEASLSTARAEYAVGVYQLRALAGTLLAQFQ